MKKILLLILLLAIIASCKKTNKENKLTNADWLIGTWENKTEEGNFIETWIKTNDSIYTGGSYYIKSKDTLHNESIVLDQKGEDVFYVPTVKGQNNDQPVPFKMTKQTTKEMVFENPKHDYPQKIVYRQITADSMVATISGIQQGKPSSDSYPMKKK